MTDKYRRTLTLDFTPAESLALREAGPERKAAALTAFLHTHRDDLEFLARLFLPPGDLYALVPGSVLIREAPEGENGTGTIRGSFTSFCSQGCADLEHSDTCLFEVPFVLRQNEILIWADAMPERDTVDEF